MVEEPAPQPARARAWVELASRFAWPLAIVAVAALTFDFLRTSSKAPASTVKVEHAGATVVRELRALARLEVLALRVEKVIDVRDQQEKLLGAVEARDALLFVAAGEVILGVDLGKLRPEDVRVDEATGAVRMRLPPPEVFAARFDEQRSYVFSRTTDVLATRNETLEATARREAIAGFEASGRDPQNVERARALAEAQLRSLARAWGVGELVIEWRGASGEAGLGR